MLDHLQMSSNHSMRALRSGSLLQTTKVKFVKVEFLLVDCFLLFRFATVRMSSLIWPSVAMIQIPSSEPEWHRRLWEKKLPLRAINAHARRCTLIRPHTRYVNDSTWICSDYGFTSLSLSLWMTSMSPLLSRYRLWDIWLSERQIIPQSMWCIKLNTCRVLINDTLIKTEALPSQNSSS